MSLRTLPVAVVILLLAGCATRSDLDYLGYQVEEINARLPKLEKELGSVRVEAREGIEKSVQALRSDLDSMRKRSAELQANLDTMLVDMNVVAGKLDDAANAAKKPAEDLTALRDDMLRRFSALETRMSRLEKGLEDYKKASETPEALYQKGMERFRAGDMAGARQLLGPFLKENPGHDLAANAAFWIGETYFKEKNYEQAVLEFQDVIKIHPSKAPAALLKQAMSFQEMGDLKSARYLYKKLSEDFPGAEETKLAKEKLKELK